MKLPEVFLGGGYCSLLAIQAPQAHRAIYKRCATLDFEQALARGEDVDALAAAWALSQNEPSLAWLKVGNGWAGEHVSRGIWIFYEVLLLL